VGSAIEAGSGVVVEVLVREEDSGVGMVEIVVAMGQALVQGQDMVLVQTEVLVIVVVLEVLAIVVVAEVLEVIEASAIVAEAISVEDRQVVLAVVTTIVVMVEEIEDMVGEDTEALSVADTVEDVE